LLALDLKTAYEGENAIFGLLSLADVTQIDVLQFIHLLVNGKISFFLMA
jgi:hypothetical protein